MAISRYTSESKARKIESSITLSTIEMLPPYPAYDPTDRGCFSFETVSRRWPVILTTVIDKVYRTNHDLASTQATPRDAAEQGIVDEQIIEGKEIIRLASKLKHEMGHDHALKCTFTLVFGRIILTLPS